MGVPYKKVFNEAIQAVQVFFHDPVGNAIELNQENKTVNLFSLAQDKIEETKVKLEQSIDLPKQPESQPESQLPTDSQPESQPESQPLSQTETNQGIKPTEIRPEIPTVVHQEPEIQMSPMSNVIMEENQETGIDIHVPDESIVQSAVTEQTDNTRSIENHSNKTQPILDQASSAVEVAAIPVATAQTADLKAEEVKPEPLVNDVSYKCESKDQESDAPKSMSNMQKIIFGSLLLAIYMI